MTSHPPWLRTARGAGLSTQNGKVAATIFAEMSQLATETGAINLGQGFPDEDGPDEVLAAAIKAISTGINQYPPGRGNPILLSAIAEHQQRFYGITLDPQTNILVTTGATEALAATILSFARPGDEVITFDPSYDAYGAIIALSGARHVPVPLTFPNFRPDHVRLSEAFSSRTRIVLINTPHNPTGAVFDIETLEFIVELAHHHNALILTDEVYEHLVYDKVHVPVATLPGAFERTLSVSSGGKTFNTTGWKVGWLTGPAELVTAVLTVKQYLSYVNAAPFQPAIATGLRLGDNYFNNVTQTMRQRRDLLISGLRTTGSPVSVPSGGYFVIADLGQLAGNDMESFSRELPKIAGIVGVPVSAFVAGNNRHNYGSLMRFAFCKKLSTIEDAVGRLTTFAESVTN